MNDAFIPLSKGVGLFQAEDARKQFARSIEKELVKHLPQVVQQQWQPIYSAVQECFDVCEKDVIQRIDDDIKSRQSELDNLLQQKQSREIDRAAELERLQGVKTAIATDYNELEAIYQSVIHGA